MPNDWMTVEEFDACMRGCIEEGTRLAKLVEAQSYGDCVSCDGYILTEAEKPHCPTCARLIREGKPRGRVI